MSAPIKPKDRDAILNALRTGVVPSIGQQHIQVGRVAEITALLTDINRVADGGTCFRMVIGPYGAGKSFFLNLVRSAARQQKLVTLHADLNPDRRLHSSGGQARSLYAELMRNAATRTSPNGGAVPAIVERFISTAKEEATAKGISVETRIKEKLSCLKEWVGGYDFATVINAYCKAHEEGDLDLKDAAIRWIRGEYSTRSEARDALDVRSVVTDASIYDHIKLFAAFARQSGYAGVFVCLDEMVNLYKLNSPQARKQNYEQILRILNDLLQNSHQEMGLGFIFGGTPEFLMDTRRGLYSYEALHSRLPENEFASGGLIDFSGPVIKLSSLTQEDFYLLLMKIRDVFAYGDPDKGMISDEGIEAFMQHCAGKLGDSYFRTPRTTITAFINLLALLEQNEGLKWEDLLGSIEVKKDNGGDTETATEEDVDDDLADLQL